MREKENSSTSSGIWRPWELLGKKNSMGKRMKEERKRRLILFHRIRERDKEEE